MKSKCVKIAILDTGVNCHHPLIQNIKGNDKIIGFSLKITNNTITTESNFHDSLGHGTAIYYLIKKNICTSNVSIYNIKIFDDEISIKQNDFLTIMEYIIKTYDFNIINISFGFKYCHYYTRMEKIFSEYKKKNIEIICAFNNNGALSYPAALGTTIGVSVDDNVKNKNNFIFYKNSIVNISGSNSIYKVPWIDNKYNIVKGSSYLTAIICSRFANNLMLHNNYLFDFEQQNCNKFIEDEEIGYLGNVAVFPFSKEEHPIACYEELINASNIDYYTTRKQGMVGKKISTVLPFSNNNKTIKCIENININNYDTIIIGHTKMLNIIEGRNYDEFILNKINSKVKIICFDTSLNIHNNNLKYISLSCLNINSLVDTRNKLFITHKPIICIAGTSSIQGKFTIQLELRKRLLNANYNVGQLGTEPSSKIFGFDSSFPCGYETKIPFSISKTIQYINQQIWKITQKNVDLIICGTQSGLAPVCNNNIYNYPIIHQIFYEVINPDVTILCVNIFDSLNLIKKCINIAESLANSKVIALVCYPKKNKNNWEGNLGKQIPLSYEEYNNFKIKIYQELKVPVYLLSDANDLNILTNNILNYFSKK